MNGESELKDEEYLIMMAKRHHFVDPSAAKAWVITAKSLFPDHFGIQFEAYRMAKDSGSVKEAALYFEEMIKNFPNETLLWLEMQAVADALQQNSQVNSTEFYWNLFSELSVKVQHEMLLAVAEHSEDTMEHCCLMVLLLSKFPDKVLNHGTQLIDTLFAAEKHGHYQSPVNQYRKLLVCDVMPVILNSMEIQIPPKQMFRLLQKSIEFYICYIVQSSWKEAQTSRKDEKHTIDRPIDDPWDQLFHLLEAAGKKLEWELADIFSTVVGSEGLWQRIVSFIQKRPYMSLGEPGGINEFSSSSSCQALNLSDDYVLAQNKQVFFCATVIFLYSLYHYGQLVNSEWLGASNNLGESSYILIEGLNLIQDEVVEQIKHKKRKLDCENRDTETVPYLTMSKSAPVEIASSLTQYFTTAFKCWDILHSNSHLKKEIARLRQHIHMDDWPWFQDFLTNTLIYQGFYKEAIDILIHQQRPLVKQQILNKNKIQLASCFYCLGNFATACEHMLDVISTFLNMSSLSSQCALVHDQQIHPRKSGRHLHFICYKPDEILHHCVKLLITCFKENAFHSTIKNDLAIGHLLVLVQHDWPREEQLFLQILDVVKKHGSFCYGLFFSYIIIPDILEEFMHLTTDNGGNVDLDLLPSSTLQVGKQRAVTRGVNKGAKEDLKSAMERQMSRSDENLNQLLVQFFKQERDIIKETLIREVRADQSKGKASFTLIILIVFKLFELLK